MTEVIKGKRGQYIGEVETHERPDGAAYRAITIKGSEWHGTKREAILAVARAARGQ